MVLHLPMMRIIVPGNVSMLMSVIFPIVMFDILENDQGIDASMLHNFDEGIPEGVDNELLDQMEDIGYETFICILNLSTMYFILTQYFLQVLFCVPLYLF